MIDRTDRNEDIVTKFLNEIDFRARQADLRGLEPGRVGDHCKKPFGDRSHVGFNSSFSAFQE